MRKRLGDHSTLSPRLTARARSVLKRLPLSLLIPFLCLNALVVLGQQSTTTLNPKPYRVLLVVERWNDPAGLLVDSQADEFQPVAALLKAWLVPFDILRLDQQRLDGSYLFDRSGKVRYGTVIWLADLPSYEGHSFEAFEEAVQAGTSLIVAKSRFLHPVLERLLGLRFKETYTAVDPFRVTRTHFITRELAAQKADPLNLWTLDTDNRLWVEPREGEVLIAQDQHPVLTLHEPAAGVSAMWMGVQHVASLRDSPYWRSLFLRSLVWSLGYLVRPNIDYSNRVILALDDWGSTEKTLHASWRYPSLSEQQIHERLITPLQKKGAVAVATTVPAFVDRKTRRIVSPWTQKFTDTFGVFQDFASTQRGLKAGVDLGVLEIQSHGWIHMQPNLQSSPGPWWAADMAGEGSAWGWYTEFEDSRREREIPAAVQLFHMKRTREDLAQDFGQVPLQLALPGGGWSKSYANYTPRLAAQAGFGIIYASGRPFYLDRSLVLDLAGVGREILHGTENLFPFPPVPWPSHPDSPLYLAGHDRDITLQPDYLDWLFSVLPSGTKTMSMNHYIAILHTDIASSVSPQDWQLTFLLDPGYCTYFATRSSSWQLWLSDPLLERLKVAKSLGISVDGSAVSRVRHTLHETLVIDLPSGTGRHTWRLEW